MLVHRQHEFAEAEKLDSGGAFWPGLERWCEPLPGAKPLKKQNPIPGLRLDGVYFTYVRDVLQVPPPLIAASYDRSTLDILRAVQTTRPLIQHHFGANSCDSSRQPTASFCSALVPSCGTRSRTTAPRPPRRSLKHPLYLRYVLAMFAIEHGGWSEGQIARLLRRSPGQVNRALAEARARFRDSFLWVRDDQNEIELRGDD